MVDFTGKIDHGVQAGIEDGDTVVSCARNGGQSMFLSEAKVSYQASLCHFSGNDGPCPHRSMCLKAHTIYRFESDIDNLSIGEKHIA